MMILNVTIAQVMEQAQQTIVYALNSMVNIFKLWRNHIILMTQYELDRVQLSVSARIRNEWSKVSNLLP